MQGCSDWAGWALPGGNQQAGVGGSSPGHALGVAAALGTTPEESSLGSPRTKTTSSGMEPADRTFPQLQNLPPFLLSFLQMVQLILKGAETLPPWWGLDPTAVLGYNPGPPSC